MNDTEEKLQKQIEIRVNSQELSYMKIEKKFRKTIME